ELAAVSKTLHAAGLTRMREPYIMQSLTNRLGLLDRGPMHSGSRGTCDDGPLGPSVPRHLGPPGKRSYAEGRAAAGAGFTLVEMLVVLVIIGLIMGLVAPRVLDYLGEAKVKAARLQIAALTN